MKYTVAQFDPTDAASIASTAIQIPFGDSRTITIRNTGSTDLYVINGGDGPTTASVGDEGLPLLSATKEAKTYYGDDAKGPLWVTSVSGAGEFKTDRDGFANA